MAEQVSSLSVPSGVKTPPMLKKSSGSYEQAKAATSSPNWKSCQYMPGIATEVESEWMEKLYQKFKDVDDLKGMIQTSINELDKDYLSQTQALNTSFDAMITRLNQRREALIDAMSENVATYKQSLKTKLNKLSADRKELTAIKKQYEQNVDNPQLTDIEKRENTNVCMIQKALNQAQIEKKKLKAKHPKYEINQTETDLYLSNLGTFILQTEIPEAPSVSVLFRTADTALIEVLMPQKYSDDPVYMFICTCLWNILCVCVLP